MMDSLDVSSPQGGAQPPPVPLQRRAGNVSWNRPLEGSGHLVTLSLGLLSSMACVWDARIAFFCLGGDLRYRCPFFFLKNKNLFNRKLLLKLQAWSTKRYIGACAAGLQAEGQVPIVGGESLRENPGHHGMKSLPLHALQEGLPGHCGKYLRGRGPKAERPT